MLYRFVYLVLDATNYPVECFANEHDADDYITKHKYAGETNMRKVRLHVRPPTKHRSKQT